MLIICANSSFLRAICYNESVYPEPERFNPDRFLDPKVPAAPVFGFGRRYSIELIIH
jgi:cytochrome P450